MSEHETSKAALTQVHCNAFAAWLRNLFPQGASVSFTNDRKAIDRYHASASAAHHFADMVERGDMLVEFKHEPYLQDWAKRNGVEVEPKGSKQ